MKDLGEYILDKYYAKWTAYRAAHYEDKWFENLAHYRCSDLARDLDNTVVEDPNSWKSKRFIGLTRTKTMAGVALVSDNILQNGGIPFSMGFDESEAAQNRDADPQEILEETSILLGINSIINRQLRVTRSASEFADLVGYGGLYGDCVARLTVDGNDNPGLEAVSNWDIVRDYSTDNVDEGLGVIQRHFMSTHSLIQFAEYQNDIIDKELLSNAITNASSRNLSTKMTTTSADETIDEIDDDNHELLECFVTVPSHLVYEGEEESIFNWTKIVCYIVNEEVVGFDEQDERYFYFIPWQKDIDNIANISIPDNTRDMQGAMNNAFRGFENNKHLSGGVWGGYNPEAIDSSDLGGIFAKSGEFFKLSDTTDDARKAIQQIIIADVGESYLSLISTIDRFSDEHSMIPKIAYGSGGSVEKTAYQTSQEIDKAGKYTSSVIRNFDKYIIEPFINDVYLYNREIGTPGFDTDLRCKALGYSTYNDRVIRFQKFQSFVQMIMQNESFAAEFSIPRVASAIGDSIGMDVVAMLKNAAEKQADADSAQAAGERQSEHEEYTLDVQEQQMEKENAEIERIKTESSVALRDQDLKEREFAAERAAGISSGRNKQQK